MKTKRFRTKTEMIETDNKGLDNYWEIAIDIGYSAVKLFGPNIIASFPSYARRVSSDFQFAGIAPKESILYRDSNGQCWIVGEVAQNTMQSGDTSDSENTLYSRDRYANPMFKVVAEAGLGIAMRDNEFGSAKGKEIFVQTGLPGRYMSDSADISEILAERHVFDLKIGAGAWEHFDFTISQNNIDVMSQPKGTLYSICVEKDGRFRKETTSYLSSSMLVFDPGFGTLDLFPINHGTTGKEETFPNLGMKRVLSETSDLIFKEYGVEIPVSAMQKYLETGTVRVFNKKEMKSQDKPFDELLAKASRKICEEAIDSIINAIPLSDYNYFVITGGTGAAWYNYISEKFKDLETLTIIKGNQNDELSLVYSNVRGYYYYRRNKLLKELKMVS